MPIWSSSVSSVTVKRAGSRPGCDRPVPPNDLPRINGVARAAHGFKKPVAQLHFTYQGMRAISARLLSQRVQHMQPNRIVFMRFESRRQADNLRIRFARTIAKLPHNIFVFMVRYQRMQPARKDYAGQMWRCFGRARLRSIRTRCVRLWHSALNAASAADQAVSSYARLSDYACSPRARF